MSILLNFTVAKVCFLCVIDWRIEQKIASHFNGCKINLLWLIEHVFYCTKKQAKKALDKAISEWLLLSMRAWDLEKLRPQVLALEKIIDKQCPQLLPELRVLLLNVQKQCENTEEAIEHARNIVNCIEKYIKQQEQIVNAKGESKEQLSQENHKIQGGNDENKMPGDTQMTLGEQTSATEINELVKALQDLLAADEKQLPKNIGEISKKIIEKQKPAKDMFKLQVAKAGVKTIDNLEDFAMQKALRISTSLKARLQGLLQAQDLKRYLPASRGRINAHRLHGLSVQDSRVFLKHTKRESTNTAVHILFDTSSHRKNLFFTTCSKSTRYKEGEAFCGGSVFDKTYMTAAKSKPDAANGAFSTRCKGNQRNCEHISGAYNFNEVRWNISTFTAWAKGEYAI